MFNGQRVNGVLLDITGVLIESSSSDDGNPIQGSIRAVQRLKELDIPVRFVTNESSITRQDLCDKLHRLGYNMDVNHIQTPAMALNVMIQSENLNPYLLIDSKIKSDMHIPHNNDEHNCVVVGDATHDFNYSNMNEAFRILIKDPNYKLFSMGKGKYYQSDGKLTMDVGGYAVALEYVSERSAIIAGKPNPDFFKAAVTDMGLDDAMTNGKGMVVMVGDDVVSDVGGAQNAGLFGILVRTGKFRPKDESHPKVKPNLIVDNLAEFVNQIG